MAEPQKYWTKDDFKEHVRNELNWSRIGWDGIPQEGHPISDMDWDVRDDSCSWIFWSREHDDPNPLLTLPYGVDNAPNNLTLKDKVRLALQQLLCSYIRDTLVQFWAATTTLDGRTSLTTQDQPFGLTQISNDELCEYRMISKDYTFYVDGEEELGIPGRVYRNKCPECTPDVGYYSVKEYPQRDRTLVRQSLHLPVIEQPSQIYVGVLELVGEFWLRGILDCMHAAFKELGLECFDSCEHPATIEKNDNEVPEDAFNEIKRVLKLLCEIHKIPLALTWVPCGACKTLLPVEDMCMCMCMDSYETIRNLYYFSMSRPPIRNGIGVVGRALSSRNLLYCSDVTQFSMAEYPLSHFARQCKLRGCFAISFQSNYTGNDVYVLEIFLPANNEDEDPLNSLSKILETMKKEFNTFRLASREELGEKLSVEVIEFQNGQKCHSVQTLQVTGSLPSLEPLQKRRRENGG